MIGDDRRPGGVTRPAPCRPHRYPDRRQPMTMLSSAVQLRPQEVFDAIAARLTGQIINVGIAHIDAAWAAGESLEPILASYFDLK